MIYIVEDDESIRNMMVYTLSVSGFEAIGCENSEELNAGMAQGKPDLIILDIMLPGEDGISILKRLRQGAETKDIPIIMASAKGTEYDKVTGLDLGADDYLAKPFGMMEMVSRVKAVLRRSGNGSGGKRIVFHELTMDENEHTVEVDSRRVELTLKEFQLLQVFMENPGKVFTRDDLLSTVWETDYVGETRTVDVHIGTLRSKLGDCGGYIKTVRGMGYRLEA